MVRKHELRRLWPSSRISFAIAPVVRTPQRHAQGPAEGAGPYRLHRRGLEAAMDHAVGAFFICRRHTCPTRCCPLARGRSWRSLAQQAKQGLLPAEHGARRLPRRALGSSRIAGEEVQEVDRLAERPGRPPRPRARMPRNSSLVLRAIEEMRLIRRAFVGVAGDTVMPSSPSAFVRRRGRQRPRRDRRR